MISDYYYVQITSLNDDKCVIKYLDIKQAIDLFNDIVNCSSNIKNVSVNSNKQLKINYHEFNDLKEKEVFMENMKSFKYAQPGENVIMIDEEGIEKVIQIKSVFKDNNNDTYGVVLDDEDETELTLTEQDDEFIIFDSNNEYFIG